MFFIFKKSNFIIGKIAEIKAILFMFFVKFYFPIKIRYREKVLFNNDHSSFEIDIICEHILFRKLAFIEVKTRSNIDILFDSISRKQLNRIYISADSFLKRNKKYKYHKVEFFGMFFLDLKFKKIISIKFDDFYQIDRFML